MAALQEVFGIATEVNRRSYVDRGGLDAHFAYVLDAQRHVAIHGDSKQGKSWLRSNALNPDETIVIQCVVNTTPEGLLTEALGRLGVRAELRQTATRELEGSLDLRGSTELGFKFLARGKAEVQAHGEITSTNAVESAPIAKAPGDLSYVAQILQESGKRIVIEDFHYMSEGHQREFAFMLKALGEYGVFPVIVGIWPQDHLLTYYNGDLDGRVEDVHLQWSEDELSLVLDKGCNALAIQFTPELRASLIADAYGNVGLLQRLAEQICLENDLTEESDGSPILGVDKQLERARLAVAETMRGRFEAFADNFVRGMRRLSEGLEVYRHLLQAVSDAEDKELLEGLDSAVLLERIVTSQASIRQSDLTQALERVDRLQVKISITPPVLSYSRSSRKLFLADRALLFFRRYGEPRWPWEQGEDFPSNDLAVSDPLFLDD